MGVGGSAEEVFSGTNIIGSSIGFLACGVRIVASVNEGLAGRNLSSPLASLSCSIRAGPLVGITIAGLALADRTT